MVSLIPYRKITYTTHLSVEEIRHKIRTNIADPRLYKVYSWFTKLPDKPFLGRTESSTFRLRNVSNRVNARRFGPIYQGKLIDRLDQRLVEITVVSSFAELLVFGLLAAYIIYLTITGAAEMLIGASLFGSGYVIMMLDFNIRSYNTLRLIKVMIQSQQE